MKIKNVEIKDNGESIAIETDHKGIYKYIFIDADDLIDIAELTERL